ncbi:hypothetical protein AMS68_003650 [Peltaster fructicola]|uniref:AHC1-like C2H2 zinc-finger domain-containing protein n=1 Tax=Peltaster fructicola TaxID=286661 RepID=A0A6H0XTT8_9PEZI|nr:hypothetical protein AMS68_003650 [Peltaster fructicola]
MQSIFRLPWCTDHFGASEKAAFGAGAIPTTMDIATLKKLKRKRAVTPDGQSTPHVDVKRQRPATAIASDYFSALPTSRSPVSTPPVTILPSATTQTVADNLASTINNTREANKENMTTQDVEMIDSQVKTAPTLSRLQQAIENQLNMQILMKHNELRLIDQELAKCQVALEQLRRCEIRPFLGNEGFDYSITRGTGAAILPPPGYTKPTHAAPHGVTDGPYTRHYRRWLLPDAQFDSQPISAISPVDDSLASRSTRHAGARKSVVATTSSRHEQHQALPSYTAPPPRKDSSTPLVLRRSTDNKLVKLVCNNCNRGNMSSIQGFLNHCRIAHKVVYESHDAAAIDCGRILDDSEIANLPTEAQTMPISKPVVKHTPNRATSIATPIVTSHAVHPMNKPGVSTSTKPLKPIAVKPVAPLATPQPAQFATAPFKAAVGLPKLSALFARRSCGGDLDQAALDARRKPDFMMDEVMSPLTPGSPAVVTPTSGRGMLAVNGRSLGGKSHGQAQRPQHSYFAPSKHNEHIQSPGEPNLSPHTVDSNPGLVSDVEDDDNGSASEEESNGPDAPMAFGVRRDCADNMEIDVAVEDGINQHGVVIRRNSMLSADRNVLGGPSSKFGN